MHSAHHPQVVAIKYSNTHEIPDPYLLARDRAEFGVPRPLASSNHSHYSHRNATEIKVLFKTEEHEFNICRGSPY